MSKRKPRKPTHRPEARKSYKQLRGRTANQNAYIESIKNNDVTVCVGPAGCGKTFLAVGAAFEMFRAGEIRRIFITRPVVEAGEMLGFLPGDINDKLDPYLRPIFDAFRYFAPHEEIAEMRERYEIEIVPIAYLRGRDLRDAVIICDEMQNITFDQMKMLITRLGQGSKMVLNGDPNQSDLDIRDRGALKFTYELFQKMDNIGTIRLTDQDIQRHSLVGQMIKSWDYHVMKFKQAGSLDD